MRLSAPFLSRDGRTFYATYPTGQRVRLERTYDGSLAPAKRLTQKKAAKRSRQKNA